MCVWDLQSAAAPSVCPAGGAAAPPPERRFLLLPRTARYLTHTHTHIQIHTLDLEGVLAANIPTSTLGSCLCISLFICVWMHELMQGFVCVSPWQIQYAGFYGDQLCASENSFHGNPIPLSPLPHYPRCPPFLPPNIITVLLKWSDGGYAGAWNVLTDFYFILLHSILFYSVEVKHNQHAIVLQPSCTILLRACSTFCQLCCLTPSKPSLAPQGNQNPLKYSYKPWIETRKPGSTSRTT